MTDILLLVGILIIASLYSSVGHGGASGYLAFMALVGIAPEIMRPAALILNIFVSSIALFSFARNKHFDLKLLLPFILTSVPLAFLGGTIEVNVKIYKLILGTFLLFAVGRMLLIDLKNKKNTLKKVNIPLALSIGALLGFLSGLIGIGGGIILSPVIILLKWANMKKTAAASAAFILVNSIAGLTGFIIHNPFPNMEIGYMVIAAVIGGFIGSYLGSFKMNEKVLRYALSIVLLFASFKLFFI